MTKDYGLYGGAVARADAQQKIAQEAAEKARAAHEREQARLADAKQPTYAENQARIQAEHEEREKREAAESARRLESQLKARYMEVPLATEEGWESAKARILREYTEQVALGTAPELKPVGEFSDPKLWGL